MIPFVESFLTSTPFGPGGAPRLAVLNQTVTRASPEQIDGGWASISGVESRFSRERKFEPGIVANRISSSWSCHVKAQQISRGVLHMRLRKSFGLLRFKPIWSTMVLLSFLLASCLSAESQSESRNTIPINASDNKKSPAEAKSAEEQRR